MKKKTTDKSWGEDHLGCYGDFDAEDTVCKKLCALNLRCAIDRDENVRMEIMEDFILSENLVIKIQ